MPSPVAPAPSRRTRSRALPLLFVALVLALALGGCARVRAALAVQPDDTVTGEIVVATPGTGPDDHGAPITVAPGLKSDVEVSAYRQDGYTGSLLRFTGLTFEQVSTLADSAGPVGRRAQLTLRRVGGRVLVTGRVDLTTVSVDRADFQLKISFPGQVIDTNGVLDAGSTVSWTFTPGEVGDINAAVAAADPNAPSVTNWTLGLGALVALTCAGVVLLARRTRNPSLRPPLR